ncbi:transglycosylase domain-containing protein [Halobacillus salinus]|uniref:Penicillin-binding protein n=1 Tax=Halobacillus salinus TaxID=192814 RepID=A0A4Z0H1P6_9BACI|nr:transglycosylase domain-containing protein [Halobacillus salinus]TGB04040.1 penicillin-binding protein [Halobacillus salinus]
MSDNQKNGRNKLDFKSLWKKGSIQKNTRITYDVVWNIILFFIIIGVIGLFFAGGVGAGYFASLVKDQPIESKQELTQNIYNYSETSEMFFSKEDQMLGKVQSDLYREEVDLDNVSEYLRNAVIATEDEYFKEHEGVVPKAVMRAIVQEVTNSSVKTGGSTLTQQLVKNQILTNEVSFERKAKEMLLALRIERFFEKDDILEAYLNIVPFGRNANGENIAGVQAAAEGIFGKKVEELNIAESAFIAGLPQSPFGYTPFTNSGEIKSKDGLEPGIDRMHEVLERMLKAEYITQAEYDEAMKFKINKKTLAKSTESAFVKYPYLTTEVQEEAKKVLKEQLAKDDGYTMKDLNGDEKLNEQYTTLAERELSSGGYKIHTTIDKQVYDVMQNAKNAYQNYGRNKTIYETDPETGERIEENLPVQVGSMIIENETGKILGFIGGRDFDVSEINYTQRRRSPGSTIKPLLVYGPSMDMGAAQPGTVIADVPYNYPGTSDDVQNYSGGYKGFVSARYALAWSYNVPAVKQFVEILPNKPYENYLYKMNFPKVESEYPSMALGTKNITVQQNTNAYATFGNMGSFTEAYMIEKIETKDGDTVYQHEAEKRDVYSPQTAYLMIDMMREVLRYGTASGVRSQLAYPGVDWAGKTGTSQNYKDSWFVATNPNVTVSMWTGYDKQAELDRGYSGRTQGIWADVVNAVSEVRPDLMVPDQGFQSPGGLVRRSYCATSGLLASDLCASMGLAKSDLYNAKYVPTKVDDSLIRGDFVKVNGKLVVAGPNTPSEFVQGSGGVTLSPSFLKENGYTSPAVLRELLPNTQAFSNVALPSSGSIGSAASSISNDGKSPNAPANISVNGNTISWPGSSSNDVVGYRVYRASVPGGSFSLIGSTVNRSFNFSGSEGIYAVRAVDYFGASSGLSSTAKVGNPGAPDPEPEPDPEPQPEPDENNDSGEENASDGNGENNDTSEEQNNDTDGNNDSDTEESDTSQDDGSQDQGDSSSDSNDGSSDSGNGE